jgi:hypothetical protein
MLNLAKLLEPETQKELEEILRVGNAERGAGWIRAFCAEHPFAGVVLRAALDQSPGDALAALAVYYPGVRLIPNAEQLIQDIQKRLRTKEK